MKKCACEEKNPVVKVAAIMGGSIVVVVLLFLLLAKESAVFSVGIAWAIVVLGIVLGSLAYKTTSNKK